MIALGPDPRGAFAVTPRGVGIGQSRKIAFLGSHHSIMYAPWQDPSWELWSHASTRTLCKRMPDRVFDLHPKEIRSTDKGQRYWNKIRQWGTPIYMAERYEDMPHAMRYPKEYILSHYQPAGENVFTNHAAWMFALALMEGVTHIGLWGISYGAGEERESQRESLIYWIGFARGQGVQVTLPHHGKHKVVINTFPKELYGYESHDNEGRLVESYRPKITDIETPDGVKTIKVGKPPENSSGSSNAPWNYYTKEKSGGKDNRKQEQASPSRKAKRRVGRRLEQNRGSAGQKGSAAKRGRSHRKRDEGGDKAKS